MAIEEWLKTFRTKSTKKVYHSAIRSFERAIGENIGDYVTKVKSGRDPFNDLLKYAISLTDKPPKTASTYMAAVRGFLEFSLDYELTRKQRKELQNKLPRGKRARTIEDDLTREKLRQILTHCDTKGRALFLLLESSGIRVGEALQLEVGEIDLTAAPPKVNVRGEYTKTGDPYYSFISSEAKDALTEWIKVRRDYLEASIKRGKGLTEWSERTGKSDGRGKKPIEDQRLFPFTFTVACAMWNRALRKAGLENRDKGTNRRTLHIHMLRKYFSSQMRLTVPRAIVEALMGHEEGLDDAYRRYTEVQIREEYQKGEPYLHVLSSEEISRLRTILEGKITRLQELTNGLARENMVLKQEVKELGETFKNNLEREARKLWDRWVSEQQKADDEAKKDIVKDQQEFTRRRREGQSPPGAEEEEQHPPPAKEEKPPPTEEKPMTNSLHDFYKQL